ncbi:MAG: hypothetical protein JSR73_11450 [Proteobacteria bacterium]|nr:hypothetical protein [Pseudomonadota bacterium]
MSRAVWQDRRPAPLRVMRTALLTVSVALLSWPGLMPAALATTAYSEVGVLSAGAVPVEQSFTPSAAQAGMIDVSVRDLAFPAPLSALRVAVTLGTTVVQSVSANGATPNPAIVSFTAIAGTTYQIRLVGRPDATLGSGAVAVSVAAHGGGSPFLTFGAAFSVPLTAGLSGSLPRQTLHFPAAGNYVAVLTDYALPAPVMTPSAGFLGAQLLQGATQVAVINPGTPTTIPIAAAGDYDLDVIAASVSGDGLIGLSIVAQNDPTVIVYPSPGSSGLTAIGRVQGPTPVTLATAGTVTLAVTDLGFPAPLATLGVVATDDAGQTVVRACPTGCGVADVPSAMAASGSLLLWRMAVAGSGGQPGSYAVQLSAPAGALYSDVESAGATSGSTGTSAFSFPVSVATAGSYTVTVTDLQAPAALAGLQFAVFQNGQVVNLGALTAPGTVTVTLAAGTATVNVVATGSTTTQGAGIFGLDVAPSANPTGKLVSVAQAVGQFTGTHSFDIGAADAGNYALTLTDAHWPYVFNTLDVFITQGSQILGKIYGGGAIPLNLAAGTYQLTFSGVPDSTQRAGLYGIEVSSVAAPTVSLSATPASVSAGSSAMLSWTSTGASACTASGGWSGSQPVSSSGTSVGPLSATTTYTLQCTGLGGSASASATVTVAAAGGGGGGGGALGLEGLLSLLVLGLLRRSSRS